MKNSAEDYLSTLNDKSAWVFTKQETDFDVSVLATKLFAEIPNIEETNVEQYFSEHHSDYEIEPCRRPIAMSRLMRTSTRPSARATA